MNTHPLISILCIVNHVNETLELLENLKNHTNQPELIEILLAVNDELPGNALLHSYAQNNPQLSIRTYGIPAVNYQRNAVLNALTSHCHPGSYFVWPVYESLRISQTGWESAILKFISYFPDHLFKLKMGSNRYRNYFNLSEALAYPAQSFIVTRQLLSRLSGWGALENETVWQQGVDFYLGVWLRKTAYISFRSLPVNIAFTQQINESKVKLNEPLQNALSMHATCLMLHLQAHQLNLNEFKVTIDQDSGNVRGIFFDKSYLYPIQFCNEIKPILA